MKTFKSLFWCVAGLFVFVLPSSAQRIAYVPLATWQQQQSISIQKIRPDSRPRYPGLRPLHVESMSDVLVRKLPRQLGGSHAKARQLIERTFADMQEGKSLAWKRMLGTAHEAMFIERHPEYGYVKKPNAQEHDVYKWSPNQRPPISAQLKFHEDGNPARYWSDLAKDSLAREFIVPDDHVQALKEYCAAKANGATANGDTVSANEAGRNYGRAKGSGYTSADVDSWLQKVARNIRNERVAAYTSLGSAGALALGPALWDWANGDLSGNRALYQITRSGSVVALGVGTDVLLQQIGDQAWRGTWRGNAVVAVVVTIGQITWLLYEHGWERALGNPDFWESIGGSISAIGFGTPVGIWVTVATSEFGPWISVPAGVLAGGAAGGMSYVGGRQATRIILEIASPNLLQKPVRQNIELVRTAIDQKIKALQDLNKLASR